MKLFEAKDRSAFALAAGFLEGEWCFGYYRGLVVTACQLTSEPLETLAWLFGGNVTSIHTPKGQQAWQWAIHGSRAAGAMMTLFTFLSSRRRDRIKDSLRGWKAAPGKGWHKYVTHCPRGHELSQVNTKRSGVSRQCRICANACRLRTYYKKKEVQANQII